MELSSESAILPDAGGAPVESFPVFEPQLSIRTDIRLALRIIIRKNYEYVSGSNENTLNDE